MMRGHFFNAGIHIRKATISVEEPENVVWEEQVNDTQIMHNSLSARSVYITVRAKKEIPWSLS